MIVVPDAGPLIYLGGAGQLELLARLFVGVVVPAIVFDEVVVAGVGLTGAAEVAAAGWIRVVDAEPEQSLLDRLDRGEAAAIPLAQRLSATLLVDDSAARTVAVARGLVVVGTLGVLLRGKANGLVDQVLPIMTRMEGLGMFIANDLRREVLRLAAENDP